MAMLSARVGPTSLLYIHCPPPSVVILPSPLYIFIPNLLSLSTYGEILRISGSAEMALQGRGNATVATVLLCMLLLHFDMAQAATYTVGESGGWSFNVGGWTQGKSFKAGDILIFNYSPSNHDVVAVSKAGYDTCTTPTGAKVYNSGKDQIQLVKGENYFICSFPGHCQGGMKLAVTAV